MSTGSSANEKRRMGELAIGTHIGRYRLDGIVGRGGMGTVYHAFDEETKREVAVKVLLPDLAESLRERFLAECEAEAKIRHPHVMPVYDRGTYGGDRLYFVMELVYEPITLTDVVEARDKGKLASRWPRLRHWADSARLVQDVFIPIAEGIDASNHDYRILHRDLKPDNVLIDVRTRRPYLIDYGICHNEGDAVEKDKIIGTPRFLSPEQARAQVSEQTDVFGLGALLHYILSGNPPIASASPIRREEREKRIHDLLKAEARARSEKKDAKAEELAARRKQLEAPDFRTMDDMLQDARSGNYLPLPEGAPAPARAIVAKAMANDPAARYERAQDMADDLRAWIEGRSVLAQTEQDAMGAAVAAAQRTVHRHLGTAALVLLGLLVGGALGHRFLSGTPQVTKDRMADMLEDVQRLESEMTAVSGLDLSPTEAGLRWQALRGRLGDLQARARDLPESDARDQASTRLASLASRLAPPRVRLLAEDAELWDATAVVGGQAVSMGAKPVDVPPGAYRLVRRQTDSAVQLPLIIPLRLDPTDDPVAPLETRIDLPAGSVPEGMVYVPAGPARVGEATMPPFLIDRDEVSCAAYAEWLDELTDAEREAHVPAVGFVRDPSRRGAFLVEPEYEDRPVVGIRPADAMAYAAWKSSLYGADYTLPTDAQWRRAAGSALLDAKWQRFFSPLKASRDGAVEPDVSPYGARALLAAPGEFALADGELVQKGLGYALGIPLTAEALEAITLVGPDERAQAGFRLVRPVH